MEDLKVVKVREPRTDLQSHATFGVLEGASNITSYQHNATSYSNANANFTIPIPSTRAALDRVVMVEIPFTATIFPNSAALTAATQPIWNAGNDAVRAYPISAITTVLTANINGVSVNIAPYLTTQALARLDTFQKDYLGSRSVAPVTTDPVSTYRGAGGLGSGGAGDGLMNPLAIYSSSAPGASVPRGAYSGIKITSNQAGSSGSNKCTIEGILTEMIPLLPFLDDENEQGQALANVKSLSFTFTFNHLSRIFSHSLAQNATAPYTLATNSWGNVQVQLGQPKMMMNWLTIKDSQEIPKNLYYPYSIIQTYPTSSGGSPIAYGSTAQLVSNSMQLQNIPRKLLIFAKMSDSVVLNGNSANMPTYTDTFLPITNLSVNWNNQTSLFAQASPQQLYTMSVSNGYSKSYQAFRGKTQVNSTVAGTSPYDVGLEGSVICITFGKDIPFGSEEYSGKTGTFNLQVRVTVENPDPLNTNCIADLVVIPITDSILAIKENMTEIHTGVGDIKLDQLPYSKKSYNELTKVYGGGFWDTLKSVFAPINEIAKETKIGSTLANLIPGIGPVASTVLKSIGYGESSPEARAGMLAGVQAGMLAGAAEKKKTKTLKHGSYGTCATRGGAPMSRSQL